MKKMVVGVLAMAMLLFGAQANAIPTLQLSDGTTTITITDDGGSDAFAGAGTVTWIGTIGVWSVNVSTGITKPAAGSAAVPYVDLNTVNLSTAAGTMTVSFSETDFVSDVPLVMVMNFGGTTANGTWTYTSYYDPDNALFAESYTIGTLVGGAPTFDGSTFGTVTPDGSNPYSLTQKVVIAHTAAGNSSGDNELRTGVPEPGTMLLLGTGLLGLGLMRRRKQD